ncbi:MAG TPA: trypsin-like peptidase domain-containing protein [Gemmatimonadaceae bacterium]|nr:trypsin-like peptidase domain-containing protein [Gemmatimonadaceae bacterium]
MTKTSPNDLSGAVERAGRAVVAIHARRRIPSSGILWRTGVIAAANHTLHRDDDISVTTADGNRIPATIAGRDPTTDLAVLRIEEKGASGAGNLPTAEIADSDALGVGSFVLAIGRPGDAVTATFGIVSALGPEWRTWRGGSIDRWIRLDLRIADGFSGGALVTAAGTIAGLNTSGLTRGSAIAIPTSTVDRVVTQLLTTGHVPRAYLGLGLQAGIRLPASLVAKLGRDSDLAPIIVSIESGSPADKGGLLVGDILANADKTPVHDASDLMEVLSADRIGKPLTLHVVRGGEPRELTITVGERPR